MSQIDDFARSLLEEAKRFLEKSSVDGTLDADPAYLHAALMLAFCSLEAHVNSVCDDFESRPEVCIHERGLLLEQEVRLEDGEFVIKPTLRMTRLEERIRFLHVKFGRPIDSSKAHWSRLAEAIKLRNELTHPKQSVLITHGAVGRAVQAIIDTIDALYSAIYRRPFPAAIAGLRSKLNF